MFERLGKYYKKQNIFETSVLSSISSGITSQSIRLRRFIKFSMMCKYYKTSSLVVQVNKAISLVGLGICGLYQDEQLESSKDSKEDKKLNVKQTTSISSNSKETKQDSKTQLPIVAPSKKVSSAITIPINVTIREIKNEELSEFKILDFKYNLPCATNHYDPIITVYFPKAVNLKADSKYLITLTNEDNKSMYIQVWGGTVPKLNVESLKQSINCNNSNINFQFFTYPIEADFNEFIYGILGDFIYSYFDY